MVFHWDVGVFGVESIVLAAGISSRNSQNPALIQPVGERDFKVQKEAAIASQIGRVDSVGEQKNTLDFAGEDG